LGATLLAIHINYHFIGKMHRKSEAKSDEKAVASSVGLRSLEDSADISGQ